MGSMRWGGRRGQAGADRRAIESAFLDGLGMFVGRASSAARTIEGARDVEGGTGSTRSLLIALSNQTAGQLGPQSPSCWTCPIITRGRVGVACTHLDFARGARVAGLPESSFGVGCTRRAVDAVRPMGSSGAGIVFRVYRVFSRSLSGREGSERVGISGV